MASFRVLLPLVTGFTVAPSKFIRKTLLSCLRISSSPIYTMHSSPSIAQTVAVATPCCPAPVSAMILVLPMRFANKPCPKALLILWAPVWAKSSRFRYICAPPIEWVRFSAKYRGVGLPAKCMRRDSKSWAKLGSDCAERKADCSSSKATIKVSGTNCPP